MTTLITHNTIDIIYNDFNYYDNTNTTGDITKFFKSIVAVST
jgi:hypothetical protein